MSNEFIGRKGALGLAKEAQAGEKTNASIWVPRVDASGIDPKKENIVDNSTYGSIVDNNQAHTVKEWSEIALAGALRQDSAGCVFDAALGKNTKLQCITLESYTGEAPQKDEEITSATGAYKAEIKKVVSQNSTQFYFVEVKEGELSSQTDVAGESFSAGNLVILEGVYGHLFEILESNNHPSYTFWESNPVSATSASYCMLDTLELEVANGDLGKFTATFVGKKVNTEEAQEYTYSDTPAFLAKHANLYFADSEAGLASATANTATRYALSIAKNIDRESGIAFGSTQPTAIYNQQLGITGSVEALYGDSTLRDYVVNDTKKACRLEMINTADQALYENEAKTLYPTIMIDVFSASFTEWSRSTDLDAMVTQSLNFQAEGNFGKTIEILLVNNISTSY